MTEKSKIGTVAAAIWIIMLILLIWIVLINVQGCDVPAQNDPIDLKVVCDANPPDQFVDFYEFYLWQGEDTLGIDTTDAVYIGTVTTWTDSVEYPFAATRNWMMGVVRAHNPKGFSRKGSTRFYSYFEFWKPTTPEHRRIKE